MSKAGLKLIKAARNAAAIAKGDAKPAAIHVPADVNVKDVRLGLKLSQEGFAAEFGFTQNQIRDWEQHRTRPTGAARAYLLIIQSEPETVRALLRKAVRPGVKRRAA